MQTTDLTVRTRRVSTTVGLSILIAILYLSFCAPLGFIAEVKACSEDDCEDLTCETCYDCGDGACYYTCDDDSEDAEADETEDCDPCCGSPVDGSTGGMTGFSGSIDGEALVEHPCPSNGSGGAGNQPPQSPSPAPPHISGPPGAGGGGGGGGGTPPSSPCGSSSAPNPWASGSVGDGVFLGLAKGQVWTKVKMVEVYAEDKVEMSVSLRYDSRLAGRDTSVGYGWTHDMGGYIEETWSPHRPEAGPQGRLMVPAGLKRLHSAPRASIQTDDPPPGGYPPPVLCERDDSNCDGVPDPPDPEPRPWPEPEPAPPPPDPEDPPVLKKVTYWQGSSRRMIFVCDPATSDPATCGFKAMNGRKDTLEYVDGHYEITLQAGGKLVFDSEAFPGLGNMYQNFPLAERHDTNEQVTRFQHDDQGRMTKAITPHGREIDFTYYTTNGHLHTITGPDGKYTALGYDTQHNLTVITDPNNNSIQYQYAQTGRMSKETLGNGRFYTIEYGYWPAYGANYMYRTISDSEGHTVARVASQQGFPATMGSAMVEGCIEVTDGRGQTWYVYRDNRGRLLQVTAPNGKQQVATYGEGVSANNQYKIISITNERGLNEEYTWNYLGYVSKKKDRAGNEWYYSYHPTKPYLVRRIEEPDGDVWAYGYDAYGRVYTIRDPLVEDPTDAMVTFSYLYHGQMDDVPAGGDPLPARLKKITRTDRDGHVTTFEYSTSGNLTTLTRGVGVLDLVTTFEYDDCGRRTRRTVQRGQNDTVVTRWVYDDGGRLTSVIHDPDGLALTTGYQYDGHNNLLHTTNPKEHVTSVEYDLRNRPWKQTVADGSLNLVTEWTYYGDSNVETIKDPNNKTTTMVYNAQNFLTSRTDPEGYTTTFTPDPVGNVLRVDRMLTTDPNGPKYSVAYTYDNVDRLLTRTVAPDTLPLTTTLDYTEAGCACRRQPHKITDPDGKITYLYYDKLDRLIKSVRKVNDTADNGGDGDDIIYQRELDPAGNVTAVQLPEGERTEYLYDEANRVEQETRIGPPGQNIVTIATYDGADNLKTVTLPNGNVVTRTYDAINRLDTVTDSVGAILDLGYDRNSNLVTRADGEGNTWAFHYDGADRLDREYDPLIESGTDKYTSHTYDNNGNRLTTTNNNGIVTRWQYDGLNRVTTATENYGGTGDTANTNTVYTYDGMSQVKTMADHNGNTTTYAYDDAGRLTDIIYPDAAPNTLHYAYGTGPKPTGRTDQKGVQTTFTWDNMYRLTQRTYPTRQETFGYNRSGRLLTANNGFVNETFDYDDLGRIESLAQAFTGGGTYTTTAVYAIGTPDSTVTLTYPAGREVTYTFDRRFRMTGVSGGAGVGGSRTLDLADQVVTSSFANGISSVFNYDDNGRLTHLERFKNGTPPTMLVEFDYGYDAVGNRRYTRDMVATDRSELYGHDARNRLRNFERGVLNPEGDEITTPLPDPVLPSQQQWTDLDRRGNWLDFSTTLNGNTTQQTRTPNEVNEVLTLDPDGSGGQPAVTLANDNNGNLTENPWAFNAGDTGTPTGQKYEYDEENRLTRVRRLTSPADEILLEIRYDAFGRRVESKEYLDAQTGQILATPRVTHHVVLGATTVEEYAIAAGPTATLAREFVYGDEFPMPVAMIVPSGASSQVYHYLRDVLGNVVALTDSSGAVVERYRYDPYGMTHIYNASGTLLPTSAYGNPFAFTGQRYDAAVGLYHFWFRTYSPSLGRWHQRDPLDYADGVSLYEYVAGSPLSWIDPFGLSANPDADQDDIDDVIRCRQNTIGDNLQSVKDNVATTVLNNTGGQGQTYLDKNAKKIAAIAEVVADPVGTVVDEASDLIEDDDFAGEKAAPYTISQIKRVLRRVHEMIGKLKKVKPGKWGSPQRGDPKKGYRLDPPHPDKSPGDVRGVWHIKWWDYTLGKRKGKGIDEHLPLTPNPKPPKASGM